MPYPVSPGRSSKVEEEEEEEEVWTVAVQREFSMRLEPAGVSCRKTFPLLQVDCVQGLPDAAVVGAREVHGMALRDT
tara:strand:+ start:1452 stop:1682 length:231 start_codon:yes stop_codon:yes gene_type:complete